jgi:hypothetical protein
MNGDDRKLAAKPTKLDRISSFNPVLSRETVIVTLPDRLIQKACCLERENNRLSVSVIQTVFEVRTIAATGLGPG